MYAVLAVYVALVEPLVLPFRCSTTSVLAILAKRDHLARPGTVVERPWPTCAFVSPGMVNPGVAEVGTGS